MPVISVALGLTACPMKVSGAAAIAFWTPSLSGSSQNSRTAITGRNSGSRDEQYEDRMVASLHLLRRDVIYIDTPMLEKALSRPRG
jgi:hypothetical protein